MIMATAKNMTVSAPGRICLFGEHQDYLGLPVIAAAVGLRARNAAAVIDEPMLIIDKPDIGERETISLLHPIEYGRARDYFKSGVRVLQKRGVEFKRGLRVTFTSGIPIGKGCSGSSAMLVAWVGLLGAAAGVALTPHEIATLAFHAEVKEFNEPGGMMDHFASALGGVQFIKTKGEFATRELPVPGAGAFVLGDSLEPKNTTEILGRVKSSATAGIEYLKSKIRDFDLETIDYASAESALGADVSENVRRVALGNLRNRDITRRALELFKTGSAGTPEFGALLDAEHGILRDDLGISTPKIETLVSAAKRAGATGCKINGSGGGGCMFAFCLEGSHRVAAAIESAGGKAFIINIDEGFREETK